MNDNLILIFWNFLSPFRCKDNPERSGVRGISENPQPERWVFVVFFSGMYLPILDGPDFKSHTYLRI